MPSFLKHMLKKLNKAELNQQVVDTSLDSKLHKLNSFMFDSLCLLLVHFKFSLEINVNTLANAPSIIQGLLAIMTIKLPDGPQDEASEHTACNAFKMDLWRIIMFFWLVQARYMVKNTSGNALAGWQLRLNSIESLLLSSKPIDISESLKDELVDEELASSRSSKQTVTELKEIYCLPPAQSERRPRTAKDSIHQLSSRNRQAKSA